MASELQRIEAQIRNAFQGGAWHGPAVLETLSGVTAAQASARPIPAVHTIAEITRHIAAWKVFVRRRLVEGRRFDVSPEEDWPSAEPLDEARWAAVVEELREAHEALIGAVREAPESRLLEPLVERGSTGYVQLHGIAEHDVYHAGQIALLKKALG